MERVSEMANRFISPLDFGYAKSPNLMININEAIHNKGYTLYKFDDWKMLVATVRVSVPLSEMREYNRTRGVYQDRNSHSCVFRIQFRTQLRPHNLSYRREDIEYIESVTISDIFGNENYPLFDVPFDNFDATKLEGIMLNRFDVSWSDDELKIAGEKLKEKTQNQSLIQVA